VLNLIKIFKLCTIENILRLNKKRLVNVARANLLTNLRYTNKSENKISRMITYTKVQLIASNYRIHV